MEQQNTIRLIPSFSITPHRLSIYNTLVRETADTIERIKLSKAEKEKILANLHGGEYTPLVRWHNFQLSDQGRKKLMLKINWLYFLAKSRYKKAISGAEIHNFKLNFITLTLSSKQKHPTSEITKTCFNQFMTEIRERYKMENFVWRIEFQKNGNVHYHIVTDTFTDFHIVQKIWNRCQDKLGYVGAYTRKHIVMSVHDYVSAYSDGGKTSFETLRYRYARGRASEWKIPNSVDVKSVSSGKKISYYISKYFAKKENKNNPCNELDNMENSLGLRLWFCSRSLSKLDKISDFLEASKIDFLSIVTSVKDTLEVVHDYCTSYFFSFSSLLAEGKAIIGQFLRNYAYSRGYIPDIG
jgi:hypothetical protein